MRTGTIAFMIGIVAAQQSSQIPSIVWLSTIPIALLGLYLAKPCFKPLFACVLGYNWVFASVLLFQHTVFSSELEGKEILLEGTIASIPKSTSRSTQFIFKTELNREHYRLKLSWYEKLEWPLQAGEHWRLLVKLKRPHGSMNPAGFDYERSLYRQRISATGYVRRNDINQRLDEDTLTKTVFDRVIMLRQSFANSLRSALKDKPHQGIVEALAIGNRGRITTSEWDILTRTGTIHLVAISGLHIGLVAGFIFFIIRFLVSRNKFLMRKAPAQFPAAVGAVLAAFIYALLAGFTIPTQRAFLMVCVFMMALLQRRAIRSSNILALSLLVMLVVDPMSVLDVGFWLSFGAVAIILFAAVGRIKTPSFIYEMNRLQIVIALGMLPLMIIFFQRVSLVAPIANVVSVPWISFVTVPATLLGTLFVNISSFVSDGMFWVATKSLEILWIFLEWLSTQSWAVLDTHVPLIWTLMPASLGAFYLLMPRGMPVRWLSLILFIPILLVEKPAPKYGELNLTLMDVGQGLSVLLQTARHSLVFDTGPRYSSNFDAGKNIIVPVLKSQGIDELDAVIVSHGDNDHSGGANSLTDAMLVHQVYSGAAPKRWRSDGAIACVAGQEWQWDGIHFEMLHPQREQGQGGNNRSCVLQVRVGTNVILLPADIERDAELQLVAQNGNKLKSNILIAPHHGSKTSSSMQFIEKVSPEIVLIANGYRNRYGFPHHSVTNRFKQAQIKWLETQHSGAISILVTPKTLSQPVRWRDKLRRYWHSQ